MIAFRPNSAPDSEQGTWRYTDHNGGKLATVYRCIDGGCQADMATNPLLDDDAYGLVVGGGLPRLPLTCPLPGNPGQLTRGQVMAEVEAHLQRAGFTVLDRPQ